MNFLHLIVGGPFHAADHSSFKVLTFLASSVTLSELASAMSDNPCVSPD
ncbi:MAG: hypothetical protein ABI972_20880 [Acidobacteriota bacterium]